MQREEDQTWLDVQIAQSKIAVLKQAFGFEVYELMKNNNKQKVDNIFREYDLKIKEIESEMITKRMKRSTPNASNSACAPKLPPPPLSANQKNVAIKTTRMRSQTFGEEMNSLNRKVEMNETKSSKPFLRFPKPVPYSKHIVLYDFAATDQKELSIKKGDCITVIDSNEEGWTYAVCEGKEGFIPTSYFK